MGPSPGRKWPSVNTSNQITLIGNIGEAPALKTKTKTGNSVVGFAIAQSVASRDPDFGEHVQQDPQWFRVVCFGSLGDRVVVNASKGDLVLVSGELKARPYTDKTGAKRLAFEIVASDVLKVERLRAPSDGSEQLSETDWDGKEASP